MPLIIIKIIMSLDMECSIMLGKLVGLILEKNNCKSK